MSNNDNANERGYGPVMVGFVAGALLGGLAGSTIALLTAPHSGRATRHMLRNKGLEVYNQATETMDEARQQAQRAVNGMQAEGKRVARQMESGTKQLQKRGQAVLDAAAKVPQSLSH